MVTNKKILVAYYSKTGNTERAAKDIAVKLGADIEKITDKKERKGFLGFLFGGRDSMRKLTTEIGPIEKNPADYDITVIGTPVWARNMTPAVRTYIEKTRGQWKSLAYFSTAGNANLEKIAAYMEELAGKNAVATTGFNARDMKNKTIYNEKVAAFVATIKSKA